MQQAPYTTYSHNAPASNNQSSLRGNNIFSQPQQQYAVHQAKQQQAPEQQRQSAGQSNPFQKPVEQLENNYVYQNYSSYDQIDQSSVNYSNVAESKHSKKLDVSSSIPIRQDMSSFQSPDYSINYRSKEKKRSQTQQGQPGAGPYQAKIASYV